MNNDIGENSSENDNNHSRDTQQVLWNDIIMNVLFTTTNNTKEN